MHNDIMIRLRTDYVHANFIIKSLPMNHFVLLLFLNYFNDYRFYRNNMYKLWDENDLCILKCIIY